MTYRLLLTSGSAHPPFKFDTLLAARDTAEIALDLGYLRRDEPDEMKGGKEDNVLIYQLGPGSSMHVASEARLDELEQQAQAEHQRLQKMAQGLVSPPSEKDTHPYYLIVQTPHGQLAPMGYGDRGHAVRTVEDGITTGWMHHSESEEDHFYLQMGPGTLYMVLSAEHYEMQKRKAIENAIQQAQQNHALKQAQRPGIIMPGGKN